MTSYDIGDTLDIQTWTVAGEGFKNAAGVLTDPTTVTLKIEEPDGTETTFTYTPGQVLKESAGRFYYRYSPDQSGTHHYRWIGTGAVAAAFEGAFHVRASQF